MVLKLYTYPKNPNAWKAQIAAEYVGVKIECPAFQIGKDNKTESFLKMNPHGKVPVLETDDGAIFESNAIARYIARMSDKGLFGTSLIESAQVEQWVDYTSNEIGGPLRSWVYPLLGFMTHDAKKEQAAKDMVQKGLKGFNDYLADKTFLVGHTITLADIVGAATLYLGFTLCFDAKFRETIPHVTRWFVTCVNQPQFKKVTGPVELCTSVAKPKAAPKAAAAAPKAAPKAAAAPTAAETAAAEEAKPKAKNPLDLLPPSKMQLDAWKRLYSNTPANKFREICIKGLWEGAPVPNSLNNEVFSGFDADGFSIWFSDFKHNDENTVNFVVMNKVSGFLQRLDYVRKYAFGAMCILKDKNGLFPIKGVWIFRGQEMPPQMKAESYDAELYEWTKADINNPAHKKLIEDMIAEEDLVDGMEHVECKVFK